MRAIAIIFVLAIATTCTRKPDSTARLIEQADSLFNTVPDYWGVVLIADKGVPVYERAYGQRDINANLPNDMSTIFELASVSKQFTSMAIMMLKEEGKLGFDDPVERYIPGLPYPGITIRHLLNHTSGLPDYQAIMDQYWDKSKVAGNADNISYLIKYQPPALFEPGSRYMYSNTGYMLLGSIVENASGHDFISFCKTRIFVPLQLTTTGIRTYDEKAQLENMAWGHTFVTGKNAFMRSDSFPENNYAIWLGNRVGPGRVSSSAGDLLKWDRALYGTSLVSMPTLLEAYAPCRLNNDSIVMYGFGWELENHASLGKIVRHSGDNPGFKTHIVRMIDKDMTVIMLCNNAHERFDELLGGVIEMVARQKESY